VTKKLLAILVLATVVLCTGSAKATSPTPGPLSATVAWNAVTNTDGSTLTGGYQLWYGTKSGVYGTPVDCGNVTQYNLSNLGTVGPYYFSVSAYDGTVGQTSYLSSSDSAEIVGWSIFSYSDSNSTITPSGNFLLQAGQSQTFTVTPAKGFTANVVVDGVSMGNVASYTLSSVSANHTVSLTSQASPNVPTGVKLLLLTQ
jgi:hypothetical protein